MRMGNYHSPIKPKNSDTKIIVNNFRTENPNYFDDGVSSPAKMILELDFYSSDYSPEKFSLFLKKFVSFLKDEKY